MDDYNSQVIKRMKQAGYSVRGWCYSRGINPRLFYLVIGDPTYGTRKKSPKTEQIKAQLKAEGFLQ